MSLSVWISSRFGTSMGHLVTELSWKWLIGGALRALSACGAGTKEAGLRVGLITPGSVADAAWNSGAYQGLTWIHDSLGLAVSHVAARTPAEQAGGARASAGQAVRQVDAGAPAEQDEALRAYAAQGYALVFAHGFEFQDAAERVSAEYPAPPFIITSGRRVSGRA